MEEATSTESNGISTCFVVMPLTMPEHLRERYGKREDHFEQIYAALIEPAIDRAGLVPSAPRREGTENIQAGIINDLRSADLVLADLSALNPNVFLELGIRSALDMPVCLIWDGLDRLPFDTGTLSTHKYDPRPVYKLNEEIKGMADHIKATLDKSDGRNELWKFFGRASEGGLPRAELDPDDASMASKLDRLLELAERPSSQQQARPLDAADLSELVLTVSNRLERAGPEGLHGSYVGRIVRSLLDENYGAFLAGRSLSSALRDVGIAIRTDESGNFYHDPEESAPVQSLEEILAELKRRGIGR